MPDYKKVEELGYGDPYVDQFFKEHGFWPQAKLAVFKHLPSYYTDYRSGVEKFRMVKCLPETRFQITGIKPGKKVKTLILMEAIGQKFSIEPKLFASSFLVDLEKPGTRAVSPEDIFGEEPRKAESPPEHPYEAPDPELAALQRARREKARVCL